MKIPTRLKIGGHQIKVKIVDHIGDSDELSPSGAFTQDENLIEIKRGQTQSQKEVTLIHEIIHVTSNTMQHPEVEYLAQALYQVLKDNKLIFDGKSE